MSHSQLPEGVKDKVKFLKGTNYSLDWTITTWLTVEGQYYSTVTVKKSLPDHDQRVHCQDTVLREDLDSAVADGGMQLNEYIELLGVHHGT
jgi:hypothetical protein